MLCRDDAILVIYLVNSLARHKMQDNYMETNDKKNCTQNGIRLHGTCLLFIKNMWHVSFEAKASFVMIVVAVLVRFCDVLATANHMCK